MDDNKKQKNITEEEVAEVQPFEKNANLKAEDCDNCESKITELDGKYKRALADYQNLERHMSAQRIVWAQMAAQDVVLKLLPILDTLMLVQKHRQDKGLELAIGQFLQVLEGEGIKRIETIGKEFDPKSMECIQTKDEGEDNKVIEEVRTGYDFKGTVLRPAQVIVGNK